MGGGVTKEYEVKVLITLRFAASCRPESLGRTNRLMLAFGRMEEGLLAHGVEMAMQPELPRLVERERRVRVESDLTAIAAQG